MKAHITNSWSENVEIKKKKKKTLFHFYYKILFLFKEESLHRTIQQTT